MTLPAHARWAAALMMCVLLPVGCAAFDALDPAGARPVTILYAGDTVLTVGQIKPFNVTVLAEGMPLPRLLLRVDSSDSTVLTLNAAGDSLVPLKVGKALLSIQLVHSSASGAALPDTTIAMRVAGGAPGP